MLNSKKIISALVLSMGLTTIATPTGFAATKTSAQLQKEINALKAQAKKKDQTIKQQQTIINDYKKKIMVSPSSGKFEVNNVLAPKSGTLTGGISVPSLLEYNGIPYAPLPLIGKMFNVPFSYDRQSNKYSLGAKTSGMIMSDYREFDPYNVEYLEEDTLINEDMYMGNKRYNKGYAIRSLFGNSFAINLDKKYTLLSGLIGMDDSSAEKAAKVTFYDEFGSEIARIDLEDTPANLPTQFEINVKNVQSLQVVLENEDNTAYLDLVNLVIK